MTTFDELGIKKSILDGLKEIGFKEAFPIQVAAIPVLLSGRDVVGQAHTGTGKTAAFSISMLQKITPNGGIQGLVIAPTRELAIQITEEIRKLAKHTGIKAATVYGGQGMGLQLDQLRRGPEIVVATPGRLIDHLKRGSIKLNQVGHLVLDEADTMLDMGFIEDIEFILRLTPKQKVMSLFSATMPPAILRLAENYLNDPKQFLLDADDLSVEGISQAFLVIKDRDKLKYLLDFIEENKKGQTIVFCSTKHRTRDVARSLERSNYNVVAIEGDMSQHRREKSMSQFRRGKADILVATDVAARGIDVPEVALVVNFDVPNQELMYFHRIGRTARAGAIGRAITLVSYSSIGDWKVIKQQTKVVMTDLNEQMGIEINIPDPLKRQVGPRRMGYQRSSYGQRRGRSSGSSHRSARDQYDRRNNKPGDRRRDGGGKSYYGLRSRW